MLEPPSLATHQEVASVSKLGSYLSLLSEREVFLRKLSLRLQLTSDSLHPTTIRVSGQPSPLVSWEATFLHLANYFIFLFRH